MGIKLQEAGVELLTSSGEAIVAAHIMGGVGKDGVKHISTNSSNRQDEQYHHDEHKINEKVYKIAVGEFKKNYFMKNNVWKRRNA